MADTSTGLDEKIAGMLSYIFGWISGIVFLILEPNNKYVRFHAFQSIIVFGALTAVGVILGWIPVLGLIVRILLSVLAFILWIILLVKSSQGQKYKVMWAGPLAEKWSDSGS
ncbi:MAG TPA: hypothetical protein G4O15_04480 [Dehalococcoidia bacterium]|nr:hypothetical protein [Dehalococcoidia bacterium]